MASSSKQKCKVTGDCQSQGLCEWLQSLGWREELQPADLRKLNTPKMRPVWRHLQAHVKPPDLAATIRKNVLLSRLQAENIHVGQFSNFKLDSISQLSKVKEVLKIEEEKERIKEQIKILDEKLQSEKFSLSQNSCKIERKRHKLSEIEDKTTILELKKAKLLKDCEKVNLNKEFVTCMKSSKNSIFQSEKNNQKSLVCKYVKNYKYPFKDSDDDSEYLCDMMASILEFKPSNILDGISHTAKEALRALNSKSLLSDITLNGTEMGSSKKVVTFKMKLKDLKMLAMRKELRISECLAKLELESKELEREKKVLLSLFSDEHRKEAGQCLDEMLKLLQEERKKKKICEDKNPLMSDEELELMDDLKQSVISRAAKDEELWREGERKVKEINTLTTTIFSGLMDSGELQKLLSEMFQLASDFKTETSEKSKKNISSSEFTEMISKEIEVFQGTPMVALQRKWNSSNEMLRLCSAVKLSNNPTLLHFLLQSEETNTVVNVLEKYIWSLHISPQFH